MLRGAILIVLLVAAGTTTMPAQSPTLTGPQFDVVSIKRNDTGRATAPPNLRPDGGFTMFRVPISTLIARAYPGHIPTDMVGLPDWALREFYDVTTTASLTNATPADRAAMMRAMLAERCKLAAHVEARERDVYELVLARRNGKLGSSLTKTDTDCSQPVPPLTRQADLSAPPPPCTLRITGAELRKPGSQPGDVLEGDAPMDRLAEALRMTNPGRPVVDKTGLSGSYRVTLYFDLGATLRPPNAPLPPDDSLSVFSALQEQLGLKLQPARLVRDTLVIDQIERPTPN